MNHRYTISHTTYLEYLSTNNGPLLLYVKQIPKKRLFLKCTAMMPRLKTDGKPPRLTPKVFSPFLFGLYGGLAPRPPEARGKDFWCAPPYSPMINCQKIHIL